MSFVRNQNLKNFLGFDHIFNEIDKISLSKDISKLAFDIIRYDNNMYEINIALAGINENDITINILDNILSVIIDKKTKTEPLEVIYKGINAKPIHQKFRLEDNIEVDEAELNNGILQIKLYKKKIKQKIKKIIYVRDI
jgi:molecular chaperone IbpA|tara:strand:- start:699 stop:1115 length:417 start_codon:yes stop_codon:yes gene_type:complete